MTTDATWQPGDPFMPDNGCGGWTHVPMTTEEREEVNAEDAETPPPWWRPESAPVGLASSRSCKPCGVRWSGEEPCWMCGGPDSWSAA
jgi:hypothetical protein